ncbi:MAG: hypothetical protein P2A85_20760 [Microcoleus anatoxicus]
MGNGELGMGNGELGNGEWGIGNWEKPEKQNIFLLPSSFFLLPSTDN